jgi:hypothetical protein
LDLPKQINVLDGACKAMVQQQQLLLYELTKMLHELTRQIRGGGYSVNITYQARL